MGTPFYYLTGYPKLFGTSFIHALTSRFKKLGVFWAVLILDSSIVLSAALISFISSGTVQNIGFATIVSIIIGGFYMAL